MRWEKVSRIYYSSEEIEQGWVLDESNNLSDSASLNVMDFTSITILDCD